MKYLVFILVVGSAIFYHLNSGKQGKNIPLPPAHVPADSPRQADPVEQKEQPEIMNQPPRMVQIHGKWYAYRADNTYMINGIPTLFIPASKSKKKYQDSDEAQYHEREERVDQEP